MELGQGAKAAVEAAAAHGLSDALRPFVAANEKGTGHMAHGSVTVAGRTLGDDEAWSGADNIVLEVGAGGATIWRWEFVTGEVGGSPVTGVGVVSHEKLTARLETIPRASFR